MEANIQNAIIIAVIGFTAVMVILAGYSIIIAAVNKMNVALANRKQNQASTQSGGLTENKVSTNQLDEETVAIIMAAATTFMGEKVRIRTITFVGSNTTTPDTAWASMSKTSKFQAHNIQKWRMQYEGK